MAGRFAVGDKVFVPSSRIGIEDLPSVFWETTVADVVNKKIKVNLRGGSYFRLGRNKSLSQKRWDTHFNYWRPRD